MATPKKTPQHLANHLPAGATILVRRSGTGTSIKLAEQLALKGGSEALVLAVGGEKAVTKLRTANGTA